MLFLAIPTAGNHPELLSDLIESSELPRGRIVITQTPLGVELPAGLTVFEDFSPPNIQKWWKTESEESVVRGAAVVAVLNDDIWNRAGSLQKLMVNSSGREPPWLAIPPSQRDRPYRRPLVQYEPHLWGCHWLLDVSSGLLPDTGYLRWFGGHDLNIRMRRDYLGMSNFNISFAHFLPGEGTGRSPVTQKIVNQNSRRHQEKIKNVQRLLFWTYCFNTLFYGTRQG